MENGFHHGYDNNEKSCLKYSLEHAYAIIIRTMK